MRAALALVAVLLVVGCHAEPTTSSAPSSTLEPSTTPPVASPSPTPTSPPAVTQGGPPSCPSYAAPDPHRPVLTAEVTVHGREVRGTERYVFTPDRAVGQLVLRLWASAPVPARSGGRSAVTTVRVDGKQRAFTRPAPTLVRVPWSGPAGTPVTIDLGFTLTLPARD